MCSRQRQLNWGFILLCLCCIPSLYHSLYSSAKALCWYWLRPFLFVSCQHFPQLVVSREETVTQSEEGKVVTKSRGQWKQAPGYSAIQTVRATSLPRPDAWNRIIIWHSMVSTSLAIFLQYAQLATSTNAHSSLLWRLVWRGPGRRGQSSVWLGVNQGCSQ